MHIYTNPKQALNIFILIKRFALLSIFIALGFGVASAQTDSPKNIDNDNNGSQIQKVSITGQKTTGSDMEAILHNITPPINQRMPVFVLKTNLISYLTTTLNIGAEIRLSKRLTLDLPVSVNPWTFKNNKKLKHILVQPEIRWWTNEPFNKHFIGFNLIYAAYNVGGIKLPKALWSGLRDYRYQGNLYGAGVSYGYQWILSNRFNLEATAGLGYFYTDYKKNECVKCGSRVDSGTKHYIGPTKLGLSLIFIIK